MPEEELAYVNKFHIKRNGQEIPFALAALVTSVEVDASIHLPSMATIAIHDQELKWVDDLSVGDELEVICQPNDTNASLISVFKGLIFALEPHFVEGDLYCELVIRAYDRLQFMQRGTKTATFNQVTDSQIAQSIIGDAGLSASVDATSAQNEHFFRNDLTSYELLKFLAQRNGYVIYADDRTVHWKKAETTRGTEIELKYGVSLLEFRPVLSTGTQVDKVQVDGWDPKNKSAVNGTASSAGYSPNGIGLGQRGSDLAKSAGGTATLHIAGTQHAQADATAIAQAALDRMSASDVTAEGVALGNPGIVPGGKVKVADVGTRFSGTYMVTRVRHVLDNSDYRTEFSVGGMSSGTVASLLSDAPPQAAIGVQKRPGLFVGLVTDNTDPEKMGRVKVKFPTIADDSESSWARVVSVGAGKDRGFLVVPEINDEVLVGFEGDDFNAPYVLGGLWNGQDAVPNPAAVDNGAVVIREFKTYSGHILRFTDKSGSEKIEIIDKTGSNKIVIDTSTKDISITCDGNANVTAQKDVVIKASGNVTVTATKDVSLSGMNVSVEGKGAVKLSAPQIELSGSGMVKISAPSVMIN